MTPLERYLKFKGLEHRRLPCGAFRVYVRREANGKVHVRGVNVVDLAHAKRLLS